MSFLFQPWHILLTVLCGLVHQRQQQIIEFQNAQIEALLKQLGKQRLLLDDNQRRLLAVKAYSLGRKALRELTTIVTPDTIFRWHRELVANKFDTSEKRKPGRPRIRQEIVDAIVRLARENPTWGYDRIQGALANLGYHIADSTVANVLKALQLPAKYLVHDNDTKFTQQFDDLFEAADTEVVKTAIDAPNQQAHVERVIQTLKFEGLDGFVIVAERHLNHICKQFQLWYNGERCHSSHDSLPPGWDKPPELAETVDARNIVCTTRLGGFLKSYSRRAA